MNGPHGARFSGRAEPPSKDSLRSRVHSRTLTQTLALLAFLLVGRIVRPSAAQCPDGSPPPCRAAQRGASTAPAPNSVAVLYFDNLSRDTADAYLAEGLTEELIAQLGRVERLVVQSRNAVRRYRAAELDPAQLEIGRASCRERV